MQKQDSTLFAANTILGTCCLDLANFTASVTPPRERNNLDDQPK